MAVFTPVTLNDLNVWLDHYPLGKAHAIHGIASGIENSNFFIDTDQGEWVLTIFEVLSFDEAPFYLHLMNHLAQRQILVPAPVANHQGQFITPLHNKPATIVSKLRGQSQMSPKPVHCKAVGHMLAKMHLAGRDFELVQDNLRGLSWWRTTTPKVLPFLNDDQRQLLISELQRQETFARSPLYQQLPRGPIHADLFRDNVMFEGVQLTGFFDFYFAGWDTWLFDIAVTVNDWCIHSESGELDAPRVKALLDAYQAIRPFSREEFLAWPMLLCAAALRFWLSRLYDFYQPREAQELTAHDPGHFERILRKRLQYQP